MSTWRRLEWGSAAGRAHARRGHAHEAHAIAQISQIPEGIEGDWSEVRSIIDQLVKIKRQREMQELAGQAATDPLAMQRYRELAASLRPS